MVIIMAIIVLTPFVSLLLKLLVIDILGGILNVVCTGTRKTVHHSYSLPNSHIDITDANKLKSKKFRKTLRGKY